MLLWDVRKWLLGGTAGDETPKHRNGERSREAVTHRSTKVSRASTPLRHPLRPAPHSILPPRHLSVIRHGSTAQTPQSRPASRFRSVYSACGASTSLATVAVHPLIPVVHHPSRAVSEQHDHGHVHNRISTRLSGPGPIITARKLGCSDYCSRAEAPKDPRSNGKGDTECQNAQGGQGDALLP